MHASVRHVVFAITVVYLDGMDFHKTFAVSASWDEGILVRFWRSKGHGPVG